MYSYKGEEPINEIPFRITLSDGSTRTDPSSFTDEEIEDAGYVVVPPKPSYDLETQTLSWDSETVSWVVSDLSEQEILDKQLEYTKSKWKAIRDERDEKINALSWRIERYNSEVRLGLTPTDDIVALDNYIQALRDITEVESISDVVWPKDPIISNSADQS